MNSLKRDIGKSGCRWLYTFDISAKSLEWIGPTHETAQKVMANIGGVATNAELENEIHKKIEQILERQKTQKLEIEHYRSLHMPEE